MSWERETCAINWLVSKARLEENKKQDKSVMAFYKRAAEA